VRHKRRRAYDCALWAAVEPALAGWKNRPWPLRPGAAELPASARKGIACFFAPAGLQTRLLLPAPQSAAGGLAGLAAAITHGQGAPRNPASIRVQRPLMLAFHVDELESPVRSHSATLRADSS